MTMQTENNASASTTTTAPAGTTETSQTTTTPASGVSVDGTIPSTTGTTGTSDSATGAAASTAGSEGEQGKQQDAPKDDAGDAPRDDQGRFKSKVQKRIDELTHARGAAEREAAHWRAIAEGRKTNPAPQAHEYPSDAAYEAAQRQHEIREAARAEVAETAQAHAERFQQDAARAIDATYQERAAAAMQRIPDFVDVVGKADIQISHDMLNAIKESEHGPDITYEMAKNPEQAARLAQMPAAQMYRELGRMEAAIEAKTASAQAPAAAPAPAARTTKAPAPAATSGAGAAPPNTDPATMDLDAFCAWARANGSKHI
jgi:hypothetical protein